MKKSFVSLLVVLSLIGLMGCTPQENPGNSKAEVKLGIIQYATHASLDAAREGFLDILDEHGYQEGKNLKVVLKNAEGDPAINQSIAQQFAEDGYDLILAIATPSAQVMANATKATPILITAITDPVEAKLATSLELPGGNVTGTSDYVSVSQQLDLIKEIMPELQKLGVIYDSGEENSIVQVGAVKEYAQANGLIIVEASPTNSGEVLQAAQALIGKVEAIYVPSDNTVVQAIEAVVKVSHEEKIPLFPAEGDSVARGGVATAGVDYYHLGQKTGRQALKIIAGEDPATIPITMQKDTTVLVNPQAAEIVGILIPDSIQEQATLVSTEAN